jgi:ubiquinone/menaquinone biosynthesis C-methylase UbiE
MEDLAVREEVQRIYEYSGKGDPEWRRLGAIGKADNIVQLCSPYPHGRVLEIGAGEGAILHRLSELDFGDDLYALEISGNAVSTIGERRIRSLRECRLYDGYHIPYDNDSFDLVLISHVLEHVEYPRKLLYEAMRVARYVFVEVPLEETIRQKRDFAFDPVGHINSYTSRSIRRFVQSAGLRVLRQSVTNPSYHVYRYRFGRRAFLRFLVKQCLLGAFPALATRLFTYHCSLMCQR